MIKNKEKIAANHLSEIEKSESEKKKKEAIA
jgi:hypothetical protein